MTLKLINFIRTLVAFTDEELDVAHSLFYEKSLRKGDFWVKEGEFNQDVLFVNKGMLRSYFMKDSLERTFDLTIENQCVTSTACYSLNLPSFDYIQAIEDTDICIISKDNLDFLFENYPKWERFGRLIFEMYTIEQEKRVRSFISETAHERYEQLNLSNPELIQRTPQIYLANFLGITPQSLSRVRRQLSR